MAILEVAAVTKDDWVPASHVRVRYRKTGERKVSLIYLDKPKMTRFMGRKALAGERVKRNGDWPEKYSKGKAVEQIMIIEMKQIVDIKKMEQNLFYGDVRVGARWK